MIELDEILQIRYIFNRNYLMRIYFIAGNITISSRRGNSATQSQAELFSYIDCCVGNRACKRTHGGEGEGMTWFRRIRCVAWWACPAMFNIIFVIPDACPGLDPG